MSAVVGGMLCKSDKPYIIIIIDDDDGGGDEGEDDDDDGDDGTCPSPDP